MITVACVWVRANVPYDVEYVANLRAMVARHLARPFRFVCLTDRPEQLPSDVEGMRVDLSAGLFGWWAKLECFRPGRFVGRIMYLDLDTLVVSSLEPVIDYPSAFALVPPGGTFSGAYKGKVRRVVHRFNSSVMVWDAGVNAQLCTGFEPRFADEFHGDQDWIGHLMPNADAMPAEWFPRLSSLNGQPPTSDAKVVLAKKPKNAIAAQQLPWVAEAWRAA